MSCWNVGLCTRTWPKARKSHMVTLVTIVTILTVVPLLRMVTIVDIRYSLSIIFLQAFDTFSPNSEVRPPTTLLSPIAGH
jgi:hypothetical protein